MPNGAGLSVCKKQIVWGDDMLTVMWGRAMTSSARCEFGSDENS